MLLIRLSKKSHLKRNIDFEKFYFNFDEVLLFMSFMINKFLNKQDLFVHIKRITFSKFFYKCVSFNNSQIRIVFMLKYHKHLIYLQKSTIYALFYLSILSFQYLNASLN